MSIQGETIGPALLASQSIAKQNLLVRWGPLFLISALSLFLELAVIRWIAGEVRLFAYFKNLPLLAAFLGLSIGFSLVGKGRDYSSAFALLLAIFVILVIAFNKITSTKHIVYPGSQDEFFWFPAQLSSWLSLIIFLGTVIVFFLFIVFLFIPLGQLIGKEMARHQPVPAYVVNILASLIGVWAFTLVSYLRTPPLLWFGLFVIGYLLYKQPGVKNNRFNLLLLVLPLAAIQLSGSQATWSPYNRLSLSELEIEGRDGESWQVGYHLNVQQVFYQSALNLSEDFIRQVNLPELDTIAYEYNLPYQFVSPGSKVLIVGAGMGNDVAAAIRNNMGSVEAVDIDASILDFGERYHPEKPYEDARVHVVVDDARSYFNKSNEKFDLIVFGLLDSHTLLSSMSSVRLDSFVYTLQSFEQVEGLLKEDGIVSLTFAAKEKWMEERLGRMMASVFGAERLYFYAAELGLTFVAGPLSEEQVSQSGLSPWRPDPGYDQVPLASDDWPYLYMRGRKVPPAYWQALLLIGLLCLALISRSFPEALRPNWHFWLLGAAFLLIEFKAITELALLFGTTWLVNALAISGVLVMALLANLLVLRTKRINLRAIYILLFLSLLVSLFFPLSRLAGLSPALRGATSTFLLTMPLFFAGIIFSESLRRFGETSKPLASNFSGSVVGGALEYASIWWGIKSLYLLAIGLYFGAMLASRWHKR